MPRKLLALAYIVILLSSASHGKVIGGNKIDSDRTDAVFLQIFNGKDLTGWSGDPAFWSVEDGVIVARVGPDVEVKNHTYLIREAGEVRDFELHVTLRSTIGNSGIDYRAERVHKDRNGKVLKWTIRGYQADIAKGWMGSLYNWGKPGAQPGQFVVVGAGETAAEPPGSVVAKEILSKVEYYKPNSWNQFTVIARGSHILHRINGYPVVEFIDNGRDSRQEGLLGLQVHSGRGPFLNEFKDIRIKRFKIKFGQAKPLFNGKDLNGWTFSGNTSKNAWSVENGVLVNKGGPEGYICTKGKYDSYVLRFQYRRLVNDENGVLLRLVELEKVQPKCIRVSGKGDDFNQVSSIGKFELKMPRKRATAKTFRKMPDGFWNECEIVLDKGRLEVRVNDEIRATAMGCERTAGKIGFETSGSHIEYRNIVLIPILTTR